jgi:hypothetical protein
MLGCQQQLMQPVIQNREKKISKPFLKEDIEIIYSREEIIVHASTGGGG